MSDEYTELRRAAIGDRMNGAAEAGNPWIQEGREPTSVLPASRPAEDKGTTHLVATDSDGNAVSITNTIMSGFGSGIIPKGTGVIMNNGMMWFDPVPGRINSIAPGRLPLNNMTPALVMNRDGVRMAVGASGGRRITNCVTQQIVKVIDYDMGPQAAIDSPRVDCSTPHTSIDPRLDPAVVAELQSRGHDIRSIPKASSHPASPHSPAQSPLCATPTASEPASTPSKPPTPKAYRRQYVGATLVVAPSFHPIHPSLPIEPTTPASNTEILVAPAQPLSPQRPRPPPPTAVP